MSSTNAAPWAHLTPPLEVSRATDNSGTYVTGADGRWIKVSNTDHYDGEWLYYSDDVRAAIAKAEESNR